MYARIAIFLLLLVCLLMTMLAQQAAKALAEQIENGDANIVEMQIDPISGNAAVRINRNNENLHFFRNVCPPQRQL